MAYTSETLKIVPISENSFLHISYLTLPEYGKVACNGAIYMNHGEAIVFDTPIDPKASNELLRWISQNQQHNITAVVINHFHDDCLGGLQAFHDLNIPSYANDQTIVLDKKEGNPVPKIGFKDHIKIKVGQETVENTYFGEGHTKDNIVSYIPSENLIFGGCMIKALEATKGNLNDANVSAWSHTVEKIRQAYPNLKTVIPGHGDFGGIELLLYTEELFKIN